MEHPQYKNTKAQIYYPISEEKQDIECIIGMKMVHISTSGNTLITICEYLSCLVGHRFMEKLLIKIIPSHFSLTVRLSHKIDQVSWVLNVCTFLVFISSALPFRHCITENVNCLLSIHDEISFGLNISL